MVFSLLPILPQAQVVTLVPEWFYLFSGLVYLLVFAVSMLISYFSFKLYRITSSKKQGMLSLAFLLIGIGFAIITATSIFTYPQSQSLDQNIFNLNTDAYNVYYILSIVAYLFLVMINLPKDERFYLFVPVWFISDIGFHSVALLLLFYVAARSVYNFFKVKSEGAFLVMFAFLMIILFHVFLLLMPFGIELYLFAHVFLIAGFLSLLAMLIRVTRK